MPSDAVYNVILRLSTEGNLGAKFDGIRPKVEAAHDGIHRLNHLGRESTEIFARAGERLGGMLESTAEKALDLGEHLAKVGIGATIALATYGVVHLNQELENTQVSLGAIAQAQGFAKTFERGFVLAGDQIAKMKQDVKTLPGDLGQLSNIMKMIATPAAQGGANLDQIRELAGKSMLVGKILGVPQEVAAREMAGLLAGRAGSHNIFGARMGLIGDEAKKFNEESPEKRLARINAELGKYQGATDRFGQTFTANWTTLADNIKYTLLGPATSPLFEAVKRDIVDINKYFDEHKDKIDAIVFKVGDQLTEAWGRIHGIIEKIEPIAGKIVEHLANLNQGNALRGIERAGEIALGAKAAGMGISAASGAVPVAWRLGSMLGRASLGAGEVASGGEAAAGLAGGVTGVATLGAALAILTPAAIAAGGAVDVLVDSTNKWHDTAMHSVEVTKGGIEAAWKDLSTTAAPLAEDLRGMADAMGVLALKVIEFKVEEIVGYVHAFTRMNEAIESWAVRFGILAPKLKEDSAPLVSTERELPLSVGMLRIAPNEKLGPDDGSPKAPKVQITQHNTIQITVNSNQDPSRVARLVMAEFEKKSASPGRSKYVPDYSQPNHT